LSNTTPSPPAGPATSRASAAQLHVHFLAILPRIERHARIRLRHLRCPGKREDAIAEAVAVAWKWFLRLDERGKDVDDFVMALADLAVRHVRCGRRLCGQERARDALSPLAQRRHGFLVQTLPGCESGIDGNQVIDALRDNTVTPPPDQATFRHDFPLWLSSLCQRDRRLALDLMSGERTLDAACKHRISPARVSQLRRRFRRDWLLFCGELPVG
jgi:hypothetical protein